MEGLPLVHHGGMISVLTPSRRLMVSQLEGSCIKHGSHQRKPGSRPHQTRVWAGFSPRKTLPGSFDHQHHRPWVSQNFVPAPRTVLSYNSGKQIIELTLMHTAKKKFRFCNEGCFLPSLLPRPHLARVDRRSKEQLQKYS